MAEFRMPSLGADMEAGRVTEWRVGPGDPVHRGDVVAVVETEKADIEIEIFQDGVIEEILVPEGTRVPVGDVLATVRQAAAVAAAAPAAPIPAVAAPPAPVLEVAAPPAPVLEVAAPAGAPPPSAPAAPPARPAAPHVSPVVRRLARERGVDLSRVAGSGRGGAITRLDVERAAGAPLRPGAGPARRRASPLARRRAAELGVDLAAMGRGSGPGGALTQADVERAAPGPAAAPPRTAERAAGGPEAPAVAAQDRTDRHLAMRRAIAALMARSKREIPHYYLGTHIDLHAMLGWLGAENLRRPVAGRLLPSILFLKATALAVHEVPEMNGFVVEDEFHPSEAVHLGVAISLRRGGLIAPALHDADRKSLDELMADLRDLVKRTREGRLRSSEMADPTITVTNLGDLGVETVHGVIYAPQVALVGFGRVAERPWAVDGMLGVRPIVEATLAADHRASDGHRGGLFLTAIDRLLQHPETL